MIPNVSHRFPLSHVSSQVVTGPGVRAPGFRSAAQLLSSRSFFPDPHVCTRQDLRVETHPSSTVDVQSDFASC